MRIDIDRKSGFCFGVINAIRKAEAELETVDNLYCLGDIVHNDSEVGRLADLGMVTISREKFFTLQNCRVLIRAHGEPPEIYEYARQNNITLIDATCPVVLQLQKRVKTAWKNLAREAGQVVILGKPGHAEIVGLNGQIGNNAIIIHTAADLDKIDFTRPVELYSQTTMPITTFHEMATIIRERAADPSKVTIRDTICRQVANRGPHLESFAKNYDVVIFVSGVKSSNGAVLFDICKTSNPSTYRIEHPDDLRADWFTGASSVGICGATSTPRWLMELVKEEIENITQG